MRYLGLFAVSVCFCLPMQFQSSQEEFKKKVNEAIKRGITYLKTQQKADGSFKGVPDWVKAPKGVTALVIYALIKSGVDKKDPVIKKGINFLLKGKLPDPNEYYREGGQYNAATAIMALGAVDHRRYKRIIKKLAQFLLSKQNKNGGWSYAELPLRREIQDTSVSQYVILGLAAAQKAGVYIPSKTWEEALRWFVKRQSKNGGWRCHNWGVKFSRSKGPLNDYDMTVAGIGSILICMNQLESRSRTRIRWSRWVLSALKKGYSWLEKNWCVDPELRKKEREPCCGCFYFYYMYGLERIGALSGKEFICGHNWYKEGATQILKLQKEDGSWGIQVEMKIHKRKFSLGLGKAVDTSFALLFLRKATKGLIETKGSRSKRSSEGIPTE